MQHQRFVDIVFRKDIISIDINTGEGMKNLTYKVEVIGRDDQPTDASALADIVEFMNTENGVVLKLTGVRSDLANVQVKCTPVDTDEDKTPTKVEEKGGSTFTFPSGIGSSRSKSMHSSHMPRHNLENEIVKGLLP